MSLRSIARNDVDANLTIDGDDVTVTIGAGTPFIVKGKIARIEARLDPDLGIQIFEKRTAISISLKDSPSEPDDTWELSTTDSEGNVIVTQAIDRRIDRTLGFVTFMMEEIG